MHRFLISIFVLSSLNGCIAIEIGHLAGIALSPRTTIRSFDDIRIVKGQRVYEGRFFQQTTIFSKASRCEYDATSVMYARDWTRVDEATGAKWEAEPGELAGVAYLAYKEYCPGKPAQDIFMVGGNAYRNVANGKYLIRDGHSVEVGDYFGMKPEDRPKWMSQVIRTIERETPKNPAARTFLEHVKIENGMPIAPTAQAETASPAPVQETQ
ncbi:MAG: hypothetical protein ITG07_15080 [Candidimonas sp.]|nr:hypothetical protein [Candidimonas sp.]